MLQAVDPRTGVPRDAPGQDALIAKVRFRNHYSYVLEPNQSFQLPHDFVMTEISKSPFTYEIYPERLVAGEWTPTILADDNRNIEFNVMVDERELLFRGDAPYLSLPNLPYKYELPVFWFMPRGTQIKFSALNIAEESGFRLAPTVVGGTTFRPTIVIGGYFLDEEPPAEVRARLFRPMVLVFKHRPVFTRGGSGPLTPEFPSLPFNTTTGIDSDAKIQSVTIPSDRDFLMKKLSFCAIRDVSMGAVPEHRSVYAAQNYLDYVGRVAYNSTFYISDKSERLDSLLAFQDWPLTMKKFLRITGGNAAVIESTYLRTAGASQGSLICCSYVLLGGALVRKT